MLGKFDRTVKKNIGLEPERQVVRSAVGLKNMSKSAIWKFVSLLEGRRLYHQLNSWGGGRGGIDCVRRFCLQGEIALEHWLGWNRIREPLGTRDLKEGAAGAVEK
jgi:hypothetical protein